MGFINCWCPPCKNSDIAERLLVDGVLLVGSIVCFVFFMYCFQNLGSSIAFSNSWIPGVMRYVRMLNSCWFSFSFLSFRFFLGYWFRYSSNAHMLHLASPSNISILKKLVTSSSLHILWLHQICHRSRLRCNPIIILPTLLSKAFNTFSDTYLRVHVLHPKHNACLAIDL